MSKPENFLFDVHLSLNMEYYSAHTDYAPQVNDVSLEEIVEVLRGNNIYVEGNHYNNSYIIKGYEFTAEIVSYQEKPNRNTINLGIKGTINQVIKNDSEKETIAVAIKDLYMGKIIQFSNQLGSDIAPYIQKVFNSKNKSSD